MQLYQEVSFLLTVCTSVYDYLDFSGIVYTLMDSRVLKSNKCLKKDVSIKS